VRDDLFVRHGGQTVEIDLARDGLCGEVDFDRLPTMSDEEVIAHLTRVKGVGVWSAQMFLIFALGRLDVMPTVDLGINMAICRHYKKRKIPKPKQILKLSEKWKPYRSLACWYLWRSSDKPETKPQPRKTTRNVTSKKARAS